ncbi:MAG TPA: inositol monophosphatase family protein, partial [Gemmatimonadaceae bacterium]
TIADRAAEQAVHEWIERRFPTDGILGEELGTVRPAAARRWIIDPIDGTNTFVRGVPLWGSLVALVEDDHVLAGAASYPATGESIAAVPGEGCWWNGARCSVSPVSSIAVATVLTTDERFAGNDAQIHGWRRLSDAARLSRSWGDCYGYLLVATGRAEVMVDGSLHPWDAAPFAPIIAEAGGVLTDWRGEATPFGGNAIATNSSLATIARNMLGAAAPTRRAPGD